MSTTRDRRRVRAVLPCGVFFLLTLSLGVWVAARNGDMVTGSLMLVIASSAVLVGACVFAASDDDKDTR